jgi:hypothetical protein
MMDIQENPTNKARFPASLIRRIAMGVRVLWLKESLLGSELFGHASGQ